MGYRPRAPVNRGLPDSALTRVRASPMVAPPTPHLYRRHTMRAFGPAALAAMMLAASPALTENLDLSTVTCKDFLAAGKDNISIILTWLDAYHLGKDAPPVIDFDR